VAGVLDLEYSQLSRQSSYTLFSPYTWHEIGG